jgi:hypothetical protein
LVSVNKADYHAPSLISELRCHTTRVFCADATPTLRTLAVLQIGKGKKINIIETVSTKWQKFGALLDFDGSGTKLELIKKTYPSDPEDCCRSMFQHWLNGNGVKPCSWRKLIELLEDSKFKSLAKDVESAISMH